MCVCECVCVCECTCMHVYRGACAGLQRIVHVCICMYLSGCALVCVFERSQSRPQFQDQDNGLGPRSLGLSTPRSGILKPMSRSLGLGR